MCLGRDEESVMILVKTLYPERVFCLTGCTICFESQAISPITRIKRFRSQEVDMKVAPFITMHNKSLPELLLPMLPNLSSASLEISVLKGSRA